ncbi:MAG: SMC family ATPase, partial [Chloroflexota bacterium]|nr:SMC family ATPase [Chloroflexota bacterium]
MILLKHLTVENFRLLREINIHFPQRGSILIQGPNEAGKSALFESIYFALYGEPLASERTSHIADDLVLYGSDSATVTLILSVGVTELTITRTIERNKGQHITLTVRKLSMPEEEPVTSLGDANTRIIAELGNVDGETLRNSCLIEQKGLTRLESLPGQKREVTLRKLLGLEKLLNMTDQFTLNPKDEQLLKECTERVQLAEVQVRIPEVSARQEQIEAALDAVTVSEDLGEIAQQEADIAEQQHSLEQLRTERTDLITQQNRIQLLRKADATLGEILECYDALAEARRELPEIEQQLKELDQREREELPSLEKRAYELAELARSFGTLERLSSDLLSSGVTIKGLEKELQQQALFQDESNALQEQIVRARGQVEQAKSALNELVEQQRGGRPQLESRLQRLQALSDKLSKLHLAEEQYARRVMSQGLADENTARLRKVQQDIQETEQELALVEKEANQTQQQAEELEQKWRQLSMRQQLEEWRRLKGLSQGLVEAEQQVMGAHQHQAQLTQFALDTRRTANLWRMILFGAIILGVVGCMVFLIAGQWLPGIVLALLGIAGAVFAYQRFNRLNQQSQEANSQMQDAINQVGMMVAARETAIRRGGSHKALVQVEHEISSLGGTVPRSIQEADIQLQQIPQDLTLAEISQQMKEQQENVSAAQNQVNTTMEAVAALRKERVRLEKQREDEGWNNIVARLRSDRIDIEDKQHEIASLAGQEGLPIPSFGSVSSSILPDGISTEFELEIRIEDTIKATERELAALDSKAEVGTNLEKQLKVQQDALDSLLFLQNALEEQRVYFQEHNP